MWACIYKCSSILCITREQDYCHLLLQSTSQIIFFVFLLLVHGLQSMWPYVEELLPRSRSLQSSRRPRSLRTRLQACQRRHLLPPYPTCPEPCCQVWSELEMRGFQELLGSCHNLELEKGCLLLCLRQQKSPHGIGNSISSAQQSDASFSLC